MSEETVFSDRRKPLSRKTLSPGRALCLGFLALILAGGLLLTLPAASADGTSLGLLKGMFTATSAVCVTGLSLIEAGRDLSLFGQIVLLCLIQVGGLGFMAFATLGMVLIGRRISLHSRILLSESMNQNGLSGMVRLSLWFFAMALAIELTGAALLASRLIPRYGTARGLWLSLFTAVSAFCNAGFDLFGNGDSLLAFRQDPVVLWTLIGLIQLGGMGFAVILELLRHRKSLGRLSLHTKLVLAVNGALLVGGSLAVFLLEGRNPATLGRDVKRFAEHGYTTVRAAAVDLFPKTAHVETVVLLSRETNPLTVEVRMEVETGEVKEHPTYKRIQEYVQEKYGFKVHTAYIAEVKRMVGLDMHKAPNAVEQRKHEYHPCPPEKVEAIKDALRHFDLIAE